MRILLTGPTGFIGSAFARLALSRGHELAALLVPGESLPATLRSHANLTCLPGTLEQAPWERIAAFSAEICVHTAWITAPGIYLDSPENERFRDSSLGFLLRLQEFGTTHVVGLGTCIEYEIGRHRLSEEHTPVGPTTTYARCKNELRLALSAAAQSHGFRFCWGRVFYPYGPGEHPSRLCSSILRKLSSGEKILLKTPLSTKDYIYIEDLAAAVLTVVEQNFSGIINLGTGTGVSVGEVARRLAQIVGKPNLVEEANPPEADPFPFVVADSERLRSLGWEPSWALERGLMQLAESVLHE